MPYAYAKGQKHPPHSRFVARLSVMSPELSPLMLAESKALHIVQNNFQRKCTDTSMIICY